MSLSDSEVPLSDSHGGSVSCVVVKKKRKIHSVLHIQKLAKQKRELAFRYLIDHPRVDVEHSQNHPNKQFVVLPCWIE